MKAAVFLYLAPRRCLTRVAVVVTAVADEGAQQGAEGGEGSRVSRPTVERRAQGDRTQQAQGRRPHQHRRLTQADTGGDTWGPTGQLTHPTGGDNWGPTGQLTHPTGGDNWGPTGQLTHPTGGDNWGPTGQLTHPTGGDT